MWPATRTVSEFFDEWFAAVEPSLDATTWQNWADYADADILPRIGEPTSALSRTTLLSLDTTLLAEGHIMCNRDTEM